MGFLICRFFRVLNIVGEKEMKNVSMILVASILVFALSFNFLGAAAGDENSKAKENVAKYVALSDLVTKTNEVSKEVAIHKVVTKKLASVKTTEEKQDAVSELVAMTLATVADKSAEEVASIAKAMTEAIMGTTNDLRQQIKYACAIVSTIHVVISDSAGNVNDAVLEAVKSVMDEDVLKFTDDAEKSPVTSIGIYQAQFCKEIYDAVRKQVFADAGKDDTSILTPVATTTTTTSTTTLSSPTPVGRR